MKKNVRTTHRSSIQYTAEVKGVRLLELPREAERLQLKPGDRIRVQIDREDQQGDQQPASASAPAPQRPSALGKYAFVAGGSEAFAREKQEELAREDRQGG